MTNYRARLVREPDGSWTAASVELPNTWSRGRSADEALEKLRAEIRYRIELCPCSGVADDFVQIDVVSPTTGKLGAEASTPASAPTPAPGPPRQSWSSARTAAPAVWRGVAGCPPPRDRGAVESASDSPSVPPPVRSRRPSRWPD